MEVIAVTQYNKTRLSCSPRLWSAILALMVAMGIAPVVSAQALEEIVVTAQKREGSLQDTPISLAVFGSADLENLSASKAGDIGEYVPNLSIRRQPSSMDNYGLAIRGIASGETSLLVEPTVGIYVDGVYLGNTVGAAFDINDMQRIEVLRGPQGTLYGRNTIGGALNVVTRRPNADFGFQQRLTGGSRGRFVSRTSIDSGDMDLGFGELALAAAYRHEERDGLLNNLADDSDIGEFESNALRLSARLTVGDVTLDYNYNNSKRATDPLLDQLVHVRTASHAALGGPVFQWAASQEDPDRVGSVRKHFNLDGLEQESEIDSHDLTVTVATPWGEIKSISGYREWESGGVNTSDFGSIHVTGAAQARVLMPTAFGTLAPLGAPRDVSLFQASRFSELERFTQEFQLVGAAFDDKLEYALGMFYLDGEVHEVNPQEFTLAGPYGAIGVAGGLRAGLVAGLKANPALPPGVADRHPLVTDPLATNKVADLLCAGAFDFQTLDISGAVTPPQTGFLPARCIGKDVVLSNPLQYGQTTESRALYAQFTWQASERLRLTLGGRYSEDEKDAYLFQRGAPGQYRQTGRPFAAGDKSLFVPAASGSHRRVPASEDWSKKTWNVNADYQWNDDFNTYATVATGYRSGGFNARASGSRSWTTPYDEENITSYEVGWKWQNSVSNLRINGAIFLNDYEDRQVAQFEAGSGGASSFISNAGEQESVGLEIDMTWLATENATLKLSYGYLDAEFQSFVTGEVDPATGFNVRDARGLPVERDLKDATVPFSPENTASLQLEYRFGDVGFGDLSFWLGVTYSDAVAYHAQLNRYDSTDDYTLVDARITLADIAMGDTGGNFRLSLWGRNLTDEEVREWGIDFGQLGFAVATYKELAHYGLDLTYQF